MTVHVLSAGLAHRLRAFYALTKPRVVSLIVFTAVIGMLLATPGMVPPAILLAATLGIALVAGADPKRVSRDLARLLEVSHVG